MTTLAVDTCIRPDQSGLGTASDGINVWGSPNGTMTTSIVSHQGTITASSGFPSVFLGSNTTADIDFLGRYTQNNNVFDGVGPCFRAADANNMYFVALYGGTGGLVFAKLSGGGFSSIATGSFSLANNQESWLRVRMIGNHLQARAWVDGTSEPSTWDIDTTDSSFSSAGRFGISTNTFASGTDTVKFDSITVTDGVSSTTVDKKFASRFFQYAVAAKKFAGRFSQYAIADKKWTSRVFQFVTAQKKFVSRFFQFATTDKKFLGRFSQYEVGQKLFRSRLFQFNQTRKLWRSHFVQYQQTQKIFLTRLRQFTTAHRTYITRFVHILISQKAFLTRFRQYVSASKKFRTRFHHGIDIEAPDAMHIIWQTRTGTALWQTRSDAATWRTRP